MVIIEQSINLFVHSNKALYYYIQPGNHETKNKNPQLPQHFPSPVEYPNNPFRTNRGHRLQERQLEPLINPAICIIMPHNTLRPEAD